MTLVVKFWEEINLKCCEANGAKVLARFWTSKRKISADSNDGRSLCLMKVCFRSVRRLLMRRVIVKRLKKRRVTLVLAMMMVLTHLMSQRVMVRRSWLIHYLGKRKYQKKRRNKRRSSKQKKLTLHSKLMMIVQVVRQIRNELFRNVTLINSHMAPIYNWRSVHRLGTLAARVEFGNR
jgi:hypothetical protein